MAALGGLNPPHVPHDPPVSGGSSRSARFSAEFDPLHVQIEARGAGALAPAPGPSKSSTALPLLGPHPFTHTTEH